MSIEIKLTDETTIIANDIYNQVDDIYEYTSYCANYTDLSVIASKLNDENMKKIVITDKYNNSMKYTNMTCASPKINIVSDSSNIEYIIRIKKKTDKEQADEAISIAIQKFTDDTAITIKALYPEFDSLIGASVEKDFKLVYYNILYKTAQATIIQEQYKPGTIDTESIFIRIDETHQGTIEDPIPYYGNQILEQGKYYIDDEGTLWICINGSVISVFDKLANLRTFATIYYEAEGTIENPIMYNGGLSLEKGKYYIQDSVIYECIRDSQIQVYNNLEDLIDNYVKVYEPIDVGEDEEISIEDGTIDNPYTYTIGSKIFKDSYYIKDGVLYIGIRDSGIPLSYNLKDLVDQYVKIVNELD